MPLQASIFTLGGKTDDLASIKARKDVSAIKALGMIANDAATISSMGDVINPYEITIEFYTTR